MPKVCKTYRIIIHIPYKRNDHMKRHIHAKVDTLKDAISIQK